MANLQAHKKQWEHNRELLATLAPDYPDWIVTVAFYAALHAVDALFAYDRLQGITSHHTRNDALKESHRYSHIWKHYAPLFALSQTVRYLAEPEGWIRFSEIDRSVLARYLYPIEKSVAKLAEMQSQPPILLRVPHAVDPTPGAGQP